MIPTKFNFYDVVKDIITGYHGTVTAVVDHTVRTIQYGVQAPIKADGTIPEVWLFDETQLVLVSSPAEWDAKPEAGREAPLVKAQFGYLDEVRCIITKYQGLVTSRTEFLNGCIRYSVQRPGDKGKVPPEHLIFEGTCKLVRKATFKERARGSGGPSGTLYLERML